MKRVTITLLAVALVVGGCESEEATPEETQETLETQEKSESWVPKTFFDRTITYTVDIEAKEYMFKLESLLRQNKQVETPLSDEVVLPIYRDTDIDRDRHITAAEAKAFYNDYVLRFEDSLGSVRY